MDAIVILGAGGHAGVVCDVALSGGAFRVLGFIDRSAEPTAHGLPVLGGDACLPGLEVDAALVGIGDNWIRARVAQAASAARPGLRFAVAVHRAATVAPGVVLGAGTVVMAGAIVNPGARIGDHCIVNTGAVVEHDAVIGDHASIAPRAVLGGGVKVGAFSAVGIGATVSHGVTIGEHAVIGAGSVVMRDVGDRLVAYGVPCRLVRPRQPGERYL